MEERAGEMGAVGGAGIIMGTGRRGPRASTRGILDSLIKLRRDIGPEAGRIPHWAVERIERALRNHPEALNELLKELAAEEVK